MREFLVKGFTVIVAAAAITVFGTGAAFAADPAPSAGSQVGNDISWPQCGKALPKAKAFAVVGVNDGLANTTNPCLAEQLDWASDSMGGTGQRLTSLYVNTANAGLAGSWWPSSNVHEGDVVDNPYGECTGAEDAACAYMYGYAKAYDDANIRGVYNPSNYFWWLDVETESSWSIDTTANVADLEGMTAYFQSINAHVGLYSTGFQWGMIVGDSVSDISNLTGLQSWLAGAGSRTAAELKCSAAPLTKGGTVALVQYVSGSLDHDYSCL